MWFAAKNIYDLPNEVLAHIVWLASSDMVTYLCLRQVSRLFRSITHGHKCRDGACLIYHECFRCDGWDLRCAQYDSTWRDSNMQWCLSLRQKDLLPLLRDRYCGPCLEARISRDNVGAIPPGCKFAERGPVALRCSACLMQHEASCFSPSEKRKPAGERKCIGRTGHVRLCEHEVITWTELESAIKQCTWVPDFVSSPRDDNVVVKTCTHESHNTGRGFRSWAPKAVITLFMHQVIALELRWNLYIVEDMVCKPGQGQQLEASALRRHIQEHRDSIGKYLAPPLEPEHLPELGCFLSKGCRCLSFEHEQHSGNNATQVGAHEELDEPVCPVHGSWKPGRIGRRTTIASSGPSSSVEYDKSCIIGDPGESPDCIVISYNRHINLVRVLTVLHDPTKGIPPTHHWLHAMDRSSYEWAGPKGSDENCLDPACKNHYHVSCEKGWRSQTGHSSLYF